MWEESLLCCVWGYNNTLRPLSAQKSVIRGLDLSSVISLQRIYETPTVRLKN